MKKEIISQVFSRHFERLKNDLSQINGFTPVMMIVISACLRNIEQDIIQKNKKEERRDDK